MCCHSNKLNVHYLHYIGRVYKSPPHEEERKTNRRHMDPDVQAPPPGIYRAQRALPASPEGEGPHGTVGTHAKEQEGGTDPSKQKCHKIKDKSIYIPVFQPNTLSPGLVRHRTEPLPQQPLPGQGPAVLGPTGGCLLPPKGTHGVGWGKGLVVKQISESL